MICYKDRTFCSASYDKCKNFSCYRYLTLDEEQRAFDKHIPIAFADFYTDCKERIEV